MAEEMHNIDIKDFTTVSSVDNYDHVVLSLFGGASAKMSVSLLRSVLVRGIIPSISQDGVWYIGEETTNVTAEGKTAVFRKGVTGVEWKYTYEEDSSWRVLILYSDLKLNYDDLTDDQREAIRLKYSDLTDEEIAELQQPANEIKGKLEALETVLKEAEGSRVKSEQERMEAETERTEAESKRKESELERIEAESSRGKSEEERILNEEQRSNAEKNRGKAENARKEEEESRIANELKRISAESDRETAEEARALNEKTRLVNESSRVLAEEARAEDFVKLKSESIAAVEDAQDTADHPTYIAEDNYVYKWDKETKTYNKTSVYVRGEGFSISRIYGSVAEMESDLAHGLKEGDFVLINTGNVEDPDNAQIYVVGKDSKFSFLVDMSGAIGFTGKTPQLIVGSVSVGNGKESASVTLSPDGNDTDGNPRYHINYIIPCLAYEDLTEEQIAGLQKPAVEMISRLQEANDEVIDSEKRREQAESERNLSEQGRIASETVRAEAESLRVISEQERSVSEGTRKEAEAARISGEKERTEAESSRTAAEGLRLQSELERKEAEEIRKNNETFRIGAESVRETAEEARALNEKTRLVNESSRVLAEEARAEDFAKLKSESIAAVEDAQDTADHPTYIAEDNYVYKWDKETKAYNKTSVYVRGEGFSISRIYGSVAEMESDLAHGLKEGDFVLINTGNVEDPDNAQIYVVGKDSKFSFLVDMSGAIGFTGKTPQLIVGSVSVGNGKESASVTLSPDGNDTDGNPRYHINYIIPCLAYEDLTEEQIADLRKPAVEMISKLQETNDEVIDAEKRREQAESERSLSEQGRIASETIRAEAESLRVISEQERSVSEDTRKEAEAARISGEKERTEAESSRTVAEGLRLQSELERKEEEEIRKNNEISRIGAESVRTSAEENRNTNEAARLLNEENRIISESSRVLAENARVESEEARDKNESGRLKAESDRVSDYEGIRKEVIEATGKANDAAEIARNLPKVQDGTWWVFDPQLMKYVDTGFAVSSDFQLTKDKVESVLTGDIKSHTHTNLLYVAQVYDEAPDLSTLDKWEDEFGEHPFHVGNDIYVKDDSEPTGYANYKMAYSASGNVWVRIPQVPDGWRIVLVKQ